MPCCREYFHCNCTLQFQTEQQRPLKNWLFFFLNFGAFLGNICTGQHLKHAHNWSTFSSLLPNFSCRAVNGHHLVQELVKVNFLASSLSLQTFSLGQGDQGLIKFISYKLLQHHQCNSGQLIIMIKMKEWRMDWNGWNRYLHHHSSHSGLLSLTHVVQQPIYHHCHHLSSSLSSMSQSSGKTSAVSRPSLDDHHYWKVHPSPIFHHHKKYLILSLISVSRSAVLPVSVQCG